MAVQQTIILTFIEAKNRIVTILSIIINVFNIQLEIDSVYQCLIHILYF